MTAHESLLEQVERHEDEIAGVLDLVERLRDDVDQTQAGVRWLSETVTAMAQVIRRLQKAHNR